MAFNNTFIPQNVMPLFTNINQQHVFKNPISFNDFELLERYGKGAFGSVFKVRYKFNGKIYAIKQYPKVGDSKESELDYNREKAILYDLTQKGYPTIVQLYADFEDNATRNLVMEFVEGITLKQLAKNYVGMYIPQDLIIHILTQLLQTLEFLHFKCFIIHRDIKPDNIILLKNNQIKLLDFGISVYLINPNKKLVSKKSYKGELHYVPPEMIFRSPPDYDYKMDIFSLGFTMYSIMNPAENGVNLPEITKQIEGGFNRRNNVIENNFYSPWLIDFVAFLYSKDKNSRPSSKGALQLLIQFKTNPNVNQIFTMTKIRTSISNNNINILFNRQSSGVNNNIINNTNNMNNINNNIFTGIPNISNINPMSSSANQINNIPNIGMPPSLNLQRMNSVVNQRNDNEAALFLNQRMGQENRIMTSMKSLLQILYRLDIMEFIKTQFLSIISNIPQEDKREYFIKIYYEMLSNVRQFNSNQINLEKYNEIINNFIQNILIRNNSGISGTRPIILFYMISSIFKDEFNQFFNSYQNNNYDPLIQNNFMNLSNIIPINTEIDVYCDVKKVILDFKNYYRGPFVDNFYFLILSVSSCYYCNNFFYVRTQVTQFLQLDVTEPKNNISDLINNYFCPKIAEGNYSCQKCGGQGKKSKKIFCLNLPNYLLLELEDKNMINFDKNISLTSYDGKTSQYQYLSGIYKFKNKDVVDFVAVIKNLKGNNYTFFSDDKEETCPEEFINLERPSLAIYKKIS